MRDESPKPDKAMLGPAPVAPGPPPDGPAPTPDAIPPPWLRGSTLAGLIILCGLLALALVAMLSGRAFSHFPVAISIVALIALAAALVGGLLSVLGGIAGRRAMRGDPDKRRASRRYSSAATVLAAVALAILLLLAGLSAVRAQPVRPPPPTPGQTLTLRIVVHVPPSPPRPTPPRDCCCSEGWDR